MGENMVQDQFSIYQVKAGREYRPYRFHAYTYMLQHSLAITEDHYDLVYTSSLYPGDDPDIIRNLCIREMIRILSGTGSMKSGQNDIMATLSVRVTLLPSTRRASPSVIIWNRWDLSACQVLFIHHPNRRILILKKQRVMQVPGGMKES